jgi:hypothetical protein
MNPLSLIKTIAQTYYLEEYLRIAPAQLKITLLWVQIIKNIPIFANICFAFRAFQNLYRRR